MSKKKKPVKKWYHAQLPVTHAVGWQAFRVQAESEEEALALLRKGKGEFVCEEVEVQDLGEPEIVDTQEIE